MWTHNLTQFLCLKKSSQKIDRDIVNQANLSQYLYSISGILKTNFQSPYLAPAVMNGGIHDCNFIFTNYGIIVTLTMGETSNNSFYAARKSRFATYDYTGASGFIPASHINNFNITGKKPIISISTKQFSFKLISIRTKLNYSTLSHIQSILTTYQASHIHPITVEGNIFNLTDDPSFAGLQSHLISLKKYYHDYSGSNNNQVIDIKARYTSQANSKLFYDCTRLSKCFIGSFTNRYILLYKLILNIGAGLYFFTGESYYIPLSYLTNEAVLAKSYDKQQFILTSPSFVLILTPEEQNYHFFHFPQNPQLLSQYMSSIFNPLFITKMQYKEYVKQQYAKISKTYINNTKGIMPKIKMYVTYSLKSYLLILVLSFLMYPTSIIMPLAISICASSWVTFYHSQTNKPKVPIILTCSVIILWIIRVFIWISRLP